MLIINLKPSHVIRLGCIFYSRSTLAMPRNVEIKARLPNPVKSSEVARELSGTEGSLLVQEDTFFNVPQGRLKLRQEREIDTGAKLIQYSRENKEGPKLSKYHITYVEDGESLKATLERALGIMGIVKKERMLYMVGQTRVHIDEVEGLGHYLELEVVLEDNQTEQEGEQIAQDLMKKLDISELDLITNAYIDLLLSK